MGSQGTGKVKKSNLNSKKEQNHVIRVPATFHDVTCRHQKAEVERLVKTGALKKGNRSEWAAPTFMHPLVQLTKHGGQHNAAAASCRLWSLDTICNGVSMVQMSQLECFWRLAGSRFEFKEAVVAAVESEGSHPGAAPWDSYRVGLSTHQFGVNHSLIAMLFGFTP